MTGEALPRPHSFTRRRAITILAATAGAAFLSARAPETDLFEWSGIALGADARILLPSEDKERAKAGIAAALAEISRLEAIFSLYDENSELVRLNREKLLAAPSLDMRRLLYLCRSVHQATDGLFDPTIQRLWRLYFEWFSGGNREMPPQAADLIAQIGFQRVSVGEERVQIPPGVELSLNGTAQGYITDRVGDVLRQQGWNYVLIDIGEVRALDGRPDGAPWQVKIREGKIEVPLRNRALAVSAGDALTLSAVNGLTHILHPATGKSPDYWKYMAVEHASAAVADALSTALFLANPREIEVTVPFFSPVTIRAEDRTGETFLHVA
ncbi:MAG: FAD:protein FMN transferase [Rhodomicrobium sp.]